MECFQPHSDFPVPCSSGFLCLMNITLQGFQFRSCLLLFCGPSRALRLELGRFRPHQLCFGGKTLRGGF